MCASVVTNSVHFSGTLKNFHTFAEVYQIWTENENYFISFLVEINHCYQLDGSYLLFFIGLPCGTRGSCLCVGLNAATQIVNNDFGMEKWNKWICLSLHVLSLPFM